MRLQSTVRIRVRVRVSLSVWSWMGRWTLGTPALSPPILASTTPAIWYANSLLGVVLVRVRVRVRVSSDPGARNRSDLVC